ncbi:MAG: histidine kinase dimerization/phospho-acceptor domain-containing protein [Acidimicrobiales bacterium]
MSEKPLDGSPANDLVKLAHEMGNHLTVVSGFAEMLAEGIGQLPDDTLREFTQAILRSAQQMGTALESFSELTRGADDR